MSKSNSKKILTGEALLSALAVTKTEVKWFRVGQPDSKIPASWATALARAGTYEGKGSATRVYWVRDLNPIEAIPPVELPRAQWQACFRTTEAPVFPPTPEWLQSVGYDLVLAL